MKQIETIFWDMCQRNLNGKKIAHSTMANMIANHKHKEHYMGNKVKVIDMFTKKQKFLPPEEWIVFKDETGKNSFHHHIRGIVGSRQCSFAPQKRGCEKSAGRMQSCQSAYRKTVLHALRCAVLSMRIQG
ncbi:MAG: hypothetical protein Q4B50_07745 [Bacillota bacterium]|nr:hypothetical protein [Bacillota bacterium]